MLKTIAKKTVAIFVGITLALGAPVAISSISPAEAHAAETPYMKTLKGLKWDLKKGKTLKVTQRIDGAGKRAATLKMTKYKVTKMANGKKKLTASWTYTYNTKFTSKQIYKMRHSSTFKKRVKEFNKYETPFTPTYFALVDYNTGKSVMSSDDVNVVRWNEVGSNCIAKKDKDGHSIFLMKGKRVDITVTFPEDYDLCFGVGIDPQFNENSKNNCNFYIGKFAFGKSNYYKNGKSSVHWMRVK